MIVKRKVKEGGMSIQEPRGWDSSMSWVNIDLWLARFLLRSDIKNSKRVSLSEHQDSPD
jgi:hypothetical protein